MDLKGLGQFLKHKRIEQAVSKKTGRFLSESPFYQMCGEGEIEKTRALHRIHAGIQLCSNSALPGFLSRFEWGIIGGRSYESL
jgi:hypothetical protein